MSDKVCMGVWGYRGAGEWGLGGGGELRVCRP